MIRINSQSSPQILCKLKSRSCRSLSHRPAQMPKLVGDLSGLSSATHDWDKVRESSETPQLPVLKIEGEPRKR